MITKKQPLSPEDIAITIHLAPLKVLEGIIYASGFILALRDARKFTNRNQDTGDKVQDGFGDHGSWLGAIGYFALLDQIGSCFKPKQALTAGRNSIIKSLNYFSSLSESEIEALYALRCGFAHDFSLISISNQPKYSSHIFTVYQGNDVDVVTLPKTSWDGDLDNINDDNITLVNLEALGDMVENIYKKLLQLSNDSDLQIMLKGGANELRKRYSVQIPTSMIN